MSRTPPRTAAVVAALTESGFPEHQSLKVATPLRNLRF
jgi:hypothetical protein